MELADDSGMCLRSGSANACFTMAWQSSNLPSIATVRILSLERGHQACAGFRSLPSREHDDADAGNLVERVCHGRAGVAAGGGEDGDLLAVSRKNLPNKRAIICAANP